MSLRDAVVIVPLVLVILAFALFPQPALDAGEPAVRDVARVGPALRRRREQPGRPDLRAQTP